MQFRQEATLSTQLASQLMLLPSMQQALQVLQLPVLELAGALREALLDNPVWEVEDPQVEKWTSNIRRPEDLEPVEAPAEQTPKEKLLEQLLDMGFSMDERALAEWLVEDLDPRGILTTPCEELAALRHLPESSLIALLERLQQLEPAGVFARSMQEHLQLQFQRLGRTHTLGYRLLQEAPEALCHLRLVELCRKSRLSEAQLLRQLQRDFSGIHIQSWLETRTIDSVLVDASVHLEAGSWRIEIHDEFWPRIVPQERYLQTLREPVPETSTHEYLLQQYRSGMFLAKALQQRGQTLRRILEAILPHQEAYLASPAGSPQILTMTSIAQQLGLSESTLSRAVNNKWIGSPRGLVSMRSLFQTQGVKGECVGLNVHQELLRIVSEEQGAHPLSDEEIAQRLQALGFNIARRTVAKYRATLGIPPQRERRWRQ